MSLSLLSRNLSFAAKSVVYARSTATPVRFGKSVIPNNVQSLVVSRQFSGAPNLRGFVDDLKQGLPSESDWTSEHLEQYLRNFAKKHSSSVNQEEADYLIKTFVTGPNSAKEFFQLDSDALIAKIGKDTPARSAAGRLLADAMSRDTKITSQRISNVSTIIIVLATALIGYLAYNKFSEPDNKEKVKSAVHDTKENARLAAHDAKGSIKSAAHDVKENVKSAAHDIKENAKSAAHDVKENVKSAAHDAKSSVQNAKDSLKSSANDTKDSVKSSMQTAKDSAKSSAQNAKDSVKSSANDAKDSAKSSLNDAKDSVKSARDSK